MNYSIDYSRNQQFYIIWNQLYCMQNITINDLTCAVLQYPAHHDLEFTMLDKTEILPHKSLGGDPDGQIQDYRIPLSDGKGLHIKEYPDNRFKVHWDYYDLKSNPVGHLVKDAPHYIIAASIILGLSFLFLKK